MIDMKSARKNDFGRVLVAVLNPKMLPTNLDVVIGDHYFEIKFEVERVGVDDNGDDIEWDFLSGGDDRDDNMEEDLSHINKDLDKEPKRSRDNDVDMEEGNVNGETNNEVPNRNKQALNPETEAKIQSMAKEILDVAFDNLIQKCCDKILAEPDDMLMEGVVEEVGLGDEVEEGEYDVNLPHPPPMLVDEELHNSASSLLSPSLDSLSLRVKKNGMMMGGSRGPADGCEYGGCTAAPGGG